MTCKASEVHSLVLGVCPPSLDLQHTSFIVKSGSVPAAGTGGVGRFIPRSGAFSSQKSR